MKLILVANAAFTLLNFRRELMQSLVSSGYEVIAICPSQCNLTQGDIKEKFSILGVTYHPIEFQRNGLNVFSDMKFLFNLIELYNDLKPDYVLNYTIKPFIYSSIAAKLCFDIKVLSNVTGLGYLFTDESFKVKTLRRLVTLQLKLASKCNDVVFFQNPDDMNDYMDFGIVNSQQTTKIISGSGVNLKEFIAIEPPVNDAIKFLFIARLIKDKGIYELIDAARVIKDIYPNVVVEIVGPLDSNPNALTMSNIKKLQSEGIVTYHGSTDNVLPFLDSCDVFILPSYREGTPRTVLEAMAVGRPIITTDVPGCRECVIEGRNGFLVPAMSSTSLVVAMKKLIDSAELRKAMGINSRNLVEKKYDVDIVVKDIIDAIEQC
ncbi:glycosyltransferase family 4 protein [Vibrio splendidus]|uniref:glycosyltransferase family 4 protein n=1 Tax=Vibrio splendidus TaxID=29497 RepID=UPI000C84A366|nr:glycosyltransferase family 4 protein [Vibrio splendidus]PMK12104.1 hypothetical protein BCU08_05140 [Vibrio splendidus]